MLAFLELNNIQLKYTDYELVKLGLGLASGKVSYGLLVEWVKTHFSL